MNAERLLEVYEQISEAPDAIARLRRFVLDLAVRGKLVEQDAGDEPASTLMKAAVALQAKEGVKIKADPLQPSETPFQAPLGWLWTRVGVIALQTGSGSTPRGGKSAYADEGTPFLRSQNVYDDGLRLDDVVFINDETNQKMKRTQVKAKDLLLNITGGSIGRCTRIPDEFAGANVSQHVAIIRTAAPGTEDYLHLLVRSPFFQEYVVGEQTGAGRGGLPKNRMDRIPVPLPPLAEQHRIVVKVDELMALCDRLENARKTREVTRDKLTAASLTRLTAPDTTHEDFPAYAAFALEALPALTTRPDQIKTLRQTILNLAVRGKLAEQDTADEPAFQETSVGPGDEPFEIPDNWSWQLFGNLADMINGDRSKNYPNRNEYQPSGIAWINTGHIQPDGSLDLEGMHYITREKFNTLRSGKIQPGDLVYCLRGATFGKTGFVDAFQEGAIASSLMIIRLKPELNRLFIYSLLMSPYGKEQLLRFDNGTAQPNLSAGNVRKFLIPVPPLAEQHRIVVKVNALMALCDRLEATLTTTDTTRTRLLEALLHEALEPATEVLEAAE